MSGSSKLTTLVSIVATLVLGPLIWFIATVVAPAVLPAPQSEQLQLIPLHTVPRAPAAIEAPARTSETIVPSHATPEPIADRWRYRSDGSLELPPENGSSSYSSSPFLRSHP